jgi:hypothetical protein
LARAWTAREQCLDAAFRAPHRGGGFGNVHLLPVTHQKGLALTGRQGLDLGFDLVQDLGAPGAVLGAFDRLAGAVGDQAFQQVEAAALVVGRFEVAQVGKQRVARLLAPKPVQRAVGQDALEQQGSSRPACRRSARPA